MRKSCSDLTNITPEANKTTTKGGRVTIPGRSSTNVSKTKPTLYYIYYNNIMLNSSMQDILCVVV